MTEAGEAPVHYGSAEAFAWQAGYEAGVAEGIRQAREAALDKFHEIESVRDSAEPGFTRDIYSHMLGGVSSAIAAIDAL